MGQLEPQLRAVLRGRIKHYLREHNCTTILVTHDQTEANALADRIAVMEGGVLQQYATPAELKARPANLFTGTFIGEPPMNVFTADVTTDGDGVAFTVEGGARLAYPAAEFSPQLRERLARTPKIALGIRPHALHLGDGPVKGKVMACQWLGDQTHVAVDVAGRTVVSASQERVARVPGSDVGLTVAARDLHLFEPASGAAIAHGGTLA
jgi:multiple sugar transport system ATP-binding protein